MARWRYLFSTLDLVFTDTASLYLEGAGGQTLAGRGFSKDRRPYLNQMIPQMLDGDGRRCARRCSPGTPPIRAV